MLLFDRMVVATVDPAENKFVLDSMRIPDPIIFGANLFPARTKNTAENLCNSRFCSEFSALLRKSHRSPLPAVEASSHLITSGCALPADATRGGIRHSRIRRA
jgi:hypothetical protein